jgi:hypothetical protein
VAETEPVAHLPRPLPREIVVEQQITPNEMRELKRVTGRSLQEILGGEAEDLDRAPDRLQALVWVALRRAGYDVTWDQAGDTAAIQAEPEPDPTPTGS